MNIDWKSAQIGVEVGIVRFLRMDGEPIFYPRLYIGEVKEIQCAIRENVTGLARNSHDENGGMQINSGALDEWWQEAEWKR